MFLKSIYSEPEGLFPVVEFKNGINYIFAKKISSKEIKKSLNGVGKTLLLHLIDYCLLSKETDLIKKTKKEKRLNMDKYSVVLEFEVDGKDYQIKRSFKDPNKNIGFGEKGSLDFFASKDLSQILCDLLFKRESYQGKYSNLWLRKLIPFYIKKQLIKKEPFTDPVKYIRECKPIELIQYHLYLMGLDNTTAYNNYYLQLELKKREPVIREIKNFIQETYQLDDISQAESEADKLNARILKLETNIKNFKLAEQYEDAEKKSNDLTSSIKELFFQNYVDKKKIESYQESFDIKDDVDITRVKRLYSELNTLLGTNISKTLKEALNFRRNLAKSREVFLLGEIKSIEEGIKTRQLKIDTLETERSKLFKFLEAKKAIEDLSDAYLELSGKREELNNLSGKIKVYLDFKAERAQLKADEANIFSQIVDFSNRIKNEITEFRKIFFELHDAIYVESRDRSSFVLSPNENIDAKIDIEINLPADLSKGKNQGRTLIYDLAILFFEIEKNIKGPRFLIHDGIFDGMDKAHFVALVEYLGAMVEKNYKFQYIITLNDEGTLNTNFGNTEKVNPEAIQEEAIITLNQTRTLFNTQWD